MLLVSLCFLMMSTCIQSLTIHLCGTDASFKFHCIEEVDGVLGSWTQQAGGGERISLDGDVMIISNDDNKIFFKYIHLQSYTSRGILRHLSLNNGILCGFNDDRLGMITCTDNFFGGSPVYYILNTSQAYPSQKLTVLNGIKASLKKYYIPIEGSIYSQVSPADEATKLLIQISYDGSTLCGVTASKEAYCATQGLPENPVFVPIPGNDYEYISVQLNVIFAIRAGNAVYQTTNPATTWTDLNKALINIETSHVV